MVRHVRKFRHPGYMTYGLAWLLTYAGWHDVATMLRNRHPCGILPALHIELLLRHRYRVLLLRIGVWLLDDEAHRTRVCQMFSKCIPTLWITSFSFLFINSSRLRSIDELRDLAFIAENSCGERLSCMLSKTYGCRAYLDQSQHTTPSSGSKQYALHCYCCRTPTQ